MRRIRVAPIERRVALGLVAAGALVTLVLRPPDQPAPLLLVAIPVAVAAVPVFAPRTWARLVPVVALAPLVAIDAMQFAPGWVATLVALIRLDRRRWVSGAVSRVDRFAALAAVAVLTLFILALLLLAAMRRR